MDQVYTAEQVATHSRLDDGWVIFQGNVYDITKFIPLHPGGALLKKFLGKDVEKVWIDGGFLKHLNSNNAYSILSNYKIGKLVETLDNSKDNLMFFIIKMFLIGVCVGIILFFYLRIYN